MIAWRRSGDTDLSAGHVHATHDYRINRQLSGATDGKHRNPIVSMDTNARLAPEATLSAVRNLELSLAIVSAKATPMPTHLELRLCPY